MIKKLNANLFFAVACFLISLWSIHVPTYSVLALISGVVALVIKGEKSLFTKILAIVGIVISIAMLLFFVALVLALG